MEPPPLPGISESALPPPMCIDQDLYCIGCGYNLRTLMVDSNCPECNLPVRESIISRPEADWLRQVRRGFAWLIAVNLWQVTITGLSFLLGRASSIYQFSGCGGLLVDVFRLIGFIKITERSLYLAPDLDRFRSRTRTVAVAAGVLLAASRLVIPIIVVMLGARPLVWYGSSTVTHLVHGTALLMLVLYARQILMARRLSVPNWFMPAMCGLAGYLLAALISQATWLYFSLQRAPGAGSLLNRPVAIYWVTSAVYMFSQLILIFFYRACRTQLKPALDAGRSSVTTG